jgi:hypothetical protein
MLTPAPTTSPPDWRYRLQGIMSSLDRPLFHE